MNKSRSIVILCIAIALILFLAVFAFMPAKLKFGNYDYYSPVNQLVYSLDLAKGNYVTYKAEGIVDDQLFEDTISVLRHRMELMEERLGVVGFSDAVLSYTDNSISIQMPDDENITITTIFSILGGQGDLVISLNEDGTEPFVPYNDEGTELSWADCIESCIAIYDRTATSNPYGISLTVDEFGLEALKEGTADISSSTPIYFILDGEVIGQPNLSAQITNATNTITGYNSVAAAQTLAIQFISGKYPVKISNTNAFESVSPVLGGKVLSYIAIALLVVAVALCVFAIVKYKLLGVSIVLSFLCFMILLVFAYAYLPLGQYFTLSAVVGVLLGVILFMIANFMFADLLKRQYNASQKKSFDTAFAEAYKMFLKIIIDCCLILFVGGLVVWLIAIGAVKTIAMTVVFTTVLCAFCSLLLTRASIINIRNITNDDHKFSLNSEVK